MHFMRHKYVPRVRRLQRNRVNRVLLSRRYYGLQPGYSNQEIQLAFPHVYQIALRRLPLA